MLERTRVDELIEGSVSHREVGHITQAIAFANEALREAFTLGQDAQYAAYENLYELYYHQNTYNEAIYNLNKMLELEPKNWKIFNNRGSIYHKHNKTAKAIYDFYQASVCDPNQTVPYENLSNVVSGLTPSALLDIIKELPIKEQIVILQHSAIPKMERPGRKGVKPNPIRDVLFWSPDTIDHIRTSYLPELETKLKAQAETDQTNANTTDNNRTVEKYIENALSCCGFSENEAAVISYFNHAIRLDPTNAETYNLLGSRYYDKDIYTEAIYYYDQAIAIKPKFAMAYYNRGKAYQARWNAVKKIAIPHTKEQFHLAMEAVNNFRKIESLLSQSWDKGEFDLEKMRKDRMSLVGEITDNPNAISVLTEMIRQNDNDAHAHHYLGEIYFYKSDYDKAVHHYTNTIEISPKSSWPYFKRGLAYRRKWKKVKDSADISQCELALNALKDFKQAIKLDGNEGRIDLAKVQGYNETLAKQLKDNPNAIACLIYATNLNKRDVLAYHLLADIYSDEGKYDQAFSLYDKAIKIDETNTEIYHQRGKLYQSLWNEVKDKAATVEEFGLAISAIYNFNKIRDSFNLKERDEHIEAIAKEILNNPNAPIVLNEFIKLNPKNAIAYSLRGQLSSHENKYDDAISDFSRGIEIDPKFRAAYYNRGLIYRKKWNEVKNTATTQEQFHFATSAMRDFNSAVEGIYSGVFHSMVNKKIKTLREEHDKRSYQNSIDSQTKQHGYVIFKKAEVTQETSDDIDYTYLAYALP